MPTLTNIAGPNGSGKSTLTATEEFEGRANLVDPDAIARRINQFAPAQVAAAAGREAIALWREYLASKTSFAVETTLAGKGTLALMREAKAQGFRIYLLYVALSSPELQVDRVGLRVSQGGHDVPDEDVRRRYERSLAHAPEALLMADEAIVFDNSGYARKKLLAVRNGRVTWRAVRLPDWVRDIERAISRTQDRDRPT